MTEFESWESYQNFELAVKERLRYIRADKSKEFLQTVLTTAEKHKVLLRKGEIFWRAQLGHGLDGLTMGDQLIFPAPVPYEADRMKPIKDRACEGRANAKGIPCLYLATTKDTACSEVRPWIGSYITVGRFKLTQRTEIIDLSNSIHESYKSNSIGDIMRYALSKLSPEEKEKIVWSDIDKAFAEPVTLNDDTADYAATQIIAELFKNAGFGGIRYRSSCSENGFNIVLFNIEGAKLIDRHLVETKKINPTFKKC